MIDETVGLVAFDGKGERVLATPGAPASLAASDERIYWMEDGDRASSPCSAPRPTGTLPDPHGRARRTTKGGGRHLRPSHNTAG